MTKRGICEARAKISWTQVETGSAVTWKYPSCILKGDGSVGEFYSVAVTNNAQQADTGTKMVHLGAKHPLDHHLQRHLGWKQPKLLPRARANGPPSEERPKLFSV